MTMRNKAKSAEPIRLVSRDKGRQVLVCPEDEDRFLLTVQEAIQACRAHKPQDRAAIDKGFNLLKDRLGQWAYRHRDQIHKAFLTIRDAGLLFLVVGKQRHRDNSLEDDLTDLDLDVARTEDLEMIPLSVLAIPRCNQSSYRSFINPSLSLVYQLNAH